MHIHLRACSRAESLPARRADKGWRSALGAEVQRPIIGQGSPWPFAPNCRVPALSHSRAPWADLRLLVAAWLASSSRPGRCRFECSWRACNPSILSPLPPGLPQSEFQFIHKRNQHARKRCGDCCSGKRCPRSGSPEHSVRPYSRSQQAAGGDPSPGCKPTPLENLKSDRTEAQCCNRQQALYPKLVQHGRHDAPAKQVEFAMDEPQWRQN
jgi:hypothetical protein